MGLDVIQQAQSGTCKTATFCSGVLQQLDYSLLECQALVLAPTHELAQQIEKVMRALGDYLQVKVHACVGGTSVREDQRILQSGVHVVVGTPGRVYDMLRRKALRADAIKCFVLDEADEMSRGFKDQVCFSLSLPLVFFLLAKSVFFGGMKRLKCIIICEVYIFCALFDYLSAHFNGVYQ
jgi:translation initiation factor 4A